MKIAYFSPLSPIQSGISIYSELNFLPYLKKFCDVDVFIDEGYTPNNEFIRNNFNVKTYKKFIADSYDAVLYNVGNNLYHDYIYETLLKYPGVVILHDPFISGLIWNKTIAKGKPEKYIEHMVYCLGEKGRKVAEKAIANNNFPDFEYPLIKKLADSSQVVIVHSEYAKEIVIKEAPNIFIKKINHPTPLVPEKFKSKKQDFKISPDTFVISTFGFVAKHKRLGLGLKAFSKFIKKIPNAKFLIVGEFLEDNYKREIEQLIKQLKISDKVLIYSGFVKNLVPYIQISDIIIQTRYPTAGETSGMTLEIMRNGKPVIVSNIGWFKELPNDVSIKIDVNNNEENSILDSFLRLYSDNDYRKELGTKAKQYVLTEHNPDKIVYDLIEFLSYLNNKDQTKFLRNISFKLNDLGIKHDDSPFLEVFSKTLQKVLH